MSILRLIVVMASTLLTTGAKLDAMGTSLTGSKGTSISRMATKTAPALSDAQIKQLLAKKRLNQSDIALLRSELSRIESKYKNAKIDADYITANTENIRSDYERLARINKGMSAKGAGSQDASRVYDGVTATFKKTKSPDLITIMAQVNDSLRKQPQDSPMFREEPSGSSKPAPSPTVTLIDTTPLPPTPSETTMPYSKVSDFDIDFKEGDSIIPAPPAPPAVGSSKPSTTLSKTPLEVHNDSLSEVRNARQSSHLLQINDDGKKARRALLQAYEHYKPIDSKTSVLLPFTTEDRIKIFREEIMAQDYREIHGLTNEEAWRRAREDIRDSKKIAALDQKYQLNELYKDVLGIPLPASSPAPSAPPASSPSAPPVESLTHSQMILGVEKAKELDDSKEALEKALNSKDLLIKSAIGVSARGDLINALKGHKITSNATGNDIKNAYKTVDEIGEQFLLIFLKKKYTAELDDEIKGARKAAVLIKEQKEIDKLNTEFDLQALFQSVLSEVPARLRISTLSSTTPVSKAPAPVPTAPPASTLASAPSSSVPSHFPMTSKMVNVFIKNSLMQENYLHDLKTVGKLTAQDALTSLESTLGESALSNMTPSQRTLYKTYVAQVAAGSKPAQTSEVKNAMAEYAKLLDTSKPQAYVEFVKVYFPELHKLYYDKSKYEHGFGLSVDTSIIESINILVKGDIAIIDVYPIINALILNSTVLDPDDKEKAKEYLNTSYVSPSGGF